MEFENIYKSRKVILEMLNTRGYTTENYDNQTKQELNIMYQNHTNKVVEDLDCLDIMVENESGKTLVKYILTNKIRASFLTNVIDNIYENFLDKTDTCVIITKDKVTYKGTLEDYLKSIFLKDKIFAQVLWLNNLLFNITEHTLVPKYRILNEEERVTFLNKYHTSINNIPNIKVNDPVALFYGFKIGDLCENEDKYYRLCIAN